MIAFAYQLVRRRRVRQSGALAHGDDRRKTAALAAGPADVSVQSIVHVLLTVVGPQQSATNGERLLCKGDGLRNGSDLALVLHGAQRLDAIALCPPCQRGQYMAQRLELGYSHMIALQT